MTSEADLEREKADLHYLRCAIRSLRLARGLSVKDLTSAAGMRPGYIAAVERSDGNPRFDKLCAIARGLGVSPTAIFLEAEQVAGHEEASRFERGHDERTPRLLLAPAEAVQGGDMPAEERRA